MPCAGRFPQGGTMTSDVIRSNPAKLPPPPRSTDNLHITATIFTQARAQTCQKLPCQERAEAGRSSGMHSAPPAGLPPPLHHSPRRHKNNQLGRVSPTCRKHIYPASNALGRTLRPAVKWPSQADPFSADLPSEGGALVSVCVRHQIWRSGLRSTIWTVADNVLLLE